MSTSQKKAKPKAVSKKVVKTIARFGRSPDSPPEWQEINKRNDEIMDRFHNRFVDRVGATPKDRLAWVVRMVNTQPQTPADWENLRFEMAVFCRRVGAYIGQPTIPTEEEAASIRDNFRSMVQKVVQGETIEVQPIPIRLVWRPNENKNEPAPDSMSMSELSDKIWAKVQAKHRAELLPRGNEGRWRRMPMDSDWQGDSVNELVELIVQLGNLLRECRAPAPRSDTTCGNWFVASRHKSRVYCSPQCTSRASTKASRKPGMTEITSKKKRGKS